MKGETQSLSSEGANGIMASWPVKLLLSDLIRIRLPAEVGAEGLVGLDGLAGEVGLSEFMNGLQVFDVVTSRWITSTRGIELG